MMVYLQIIGVTTPLILYLNYIHKRNKKLDFKNGFTQNVDLFCRSAYVCLFKSNKQTLVL